MSSVNPIYGMFKTDRNVEREGILVNYGGVRFRVARAGGANAKFKNVFQELSKPYRRQIDTETLDDETAERIGREVYARTVILGWETRKTDENGDPVKVDGKEVWEPVFVTDKGERLDFTTANVMKVLEDLPELFTDIKVMAQNHANFRRSEVEADKGN